ncbi:hypothetical protein Lser_V15G41956 [Lactuca serriola]
MEKVHTSHSLILLLTLLIASFILTTSITNPNHQTSNFKNQNAKRVKKGEVRVHAKGEKDQARIPYPAYASADGFQEMEEGEKDDEKMVHGLNGDLYYDGPPQGYFGYPFPGGIFGFPRGIFGFPRGFFGYPLGFRGGLLPGGYGGFPGGYGGYPYPGSYGGYPGGDGGNPGGYGGGGPGNKPGGGGGGAGGHGSGGGYPGYGGQAKEVKGKRVNPCD